MATNKKAQVVITCDGKTALKVTEMLAKKIEELKREMQSLDVTTKEGAKRQKELEKELFAYNSYQKENISNYQRMQHAIKNLSTTSLKDLKRALSAAKSELGKMSEGDKRLPMVQKRVKMLQDQVDKLTGSVHKNSGAWNTALKNLTAYVGLFAAFNKAKELITGVIRKNYEYSGSLTDIRKVAGLAKADIDDLSRSLAKIDTRTTTDELAQLAYQGAKLGMSKYGVEGMAEFVKAADQINVAIGEEMGEEALPALAKLVETMGLIPKLGVERSLLSTGSALFKLATTSTATSGNIVEFSKRLTGMSRTAGITTDQLLALGSAADSMMLMPEVASTAFSKLIASLQRHPAAIEKALQMPEGRINELFSAGNAMQAIVEILDTMKKKGNMNALDDVFKDLGSDGARLISVMVTMSKNVDVLKDHLDTANEAFREGEAVTAEYKMQQESAIGILERAQNLWTKAFVNPEGVDNVKELAQAWYDMSKVLTENAVYIDSMKGALWMFLQAAKALVVILPALLAGLMFKGVSSALLGIKTALFGVGETAIWTTLKTHGLKAAWKELNIAMKANWISAVIGLFVELGVVIYETMFKTKELSKATNELNGYLHEAASQYDAERRKIDSYVAAMEDANTSEEQRQRLIKKFNSEYGSYLEKLGYEVTDVTTLKDAYVALNEELQKKIYWQIRDKAYQDKLGDASGVVGDATMNYSKYINSNKGKTWSAFDTKWLQDQVNAGKDAESIYKDMVEAVYGKGGVWSGYNGDYLVGQGARQESVNDKALKDYISKFVSAGQKYNSTKKDIDDAFNGLIGDYDPFKSELPGTLDNDNTKDKGGKGKTNNDNKIAKDRANALIANIKAFYEEQERAYLEWVAKMNETEETVTKEEQARRISEFEENKKRALGTARQSIATLGTEWETYLKDELPKHMFNKDDEVSKQLMEAMGKSDIKGLHALFEKLSGDLSRENNRTLSENLGALLDQIFANGSKELREAAEKLLERQRELYAILNRDKFVDNVNQQTRGNLDKWQFLTPANGIDANTEQGQRQLSQGFRELISKTRSQVHDLYEMLLVEDEKKFEDQMHAFLAAATKNFDFSNIKGKELHALLLMLIDDERNYEKALKDTDAQMKQRNDEAWLKDPRNKAYTENIRDMENALTFQKLYGDKKSNIRGHEDTRSSIQKKRERDLPYEGDELQTSWRGVGEGMGFEFKIDNDPELLLIEERMKREREAFMEKQRLHELGQASDEEYNESLKTYLSSLSAYSDRVLQDISSQTDALMSFMSPIMSFGEAVGDAFATMREDAAQGKKAMQNALKQMIKSFATQSLQLIMKNEQEQANMAMHYATMIAMRTAFGQAELQAEQANEAAMLATQSANNAAEVNLEAIKEQQKVALRSAGIFGWCVSTLGPIAGPIAYSAMMATLMGLLNYALSFIGGGSDTGAVASQAKGPNTKLVSGMLTYDSGNVQDLKPFFDKDGNMYWATEDDDRNHDGINLLTHPTATTINGQRALVAEKGPELVIGRETTAAMMQNNPALLKALYQYDKHHSGRTAYDQGNLSQMTMVSTPSPFTGDGQGRGATDAALIGAITALVARLNEPINASINMYGRDGLYEQHRRATAFMKGK